MNGGVREIHNGPLFIPMSFNVGPAADLPWIEYEDEEEPERLFLFPSGTPIP
jgi:hypothetical protein